jgi:hypothetical protein
MNIPSNRNSTAKRNRDLAASGFTLALLDEELIDGSAAAQTLDGLEFLEDLPALAAQFRGSGSEGAPGNAVSRQIQYPAKTSPWIDRI